MFFLFLIMEIFIIKKFELIWLEVKLIFCLSFLFLIVFRFWWKKFILGFSLIVFLYLIMVWVKLFCFFRVFFNL